MMAKTYRITSETINFSLVVPDDTTRDELKAEIRQVGGELAEQQRQVLARGTWTYLVERVNDDDEDVLGNLWASYYRDLEE
jgi:hypothetical protein